MLRGSTHERLFLMNLGAGGYDRAPYSFSDPDTDLAVISLDQRDDLFAADLEKRGYEPIPFVDIGTRPSAVGTEVFQRWLP